MPRNAALKSLWSAGLAVAIALSATTLLAIAPRSSDAGSPSDVKLETLKFDRFQTRLAAAKANKFKYSLVDAWASNCGPCKENFPHLVEMHKKYGPKGLQVISLSLDDTTDAQAVESARSFLVEKGATFLNVLLDEEFGVGYEKLDINAIPAVFLYDSDGKQVRRYTMDDPNKQFTYEEVERDVAKLLGASAG